MRERPVHPVIRAWRGLRAWYSTPRPALLRALRNTGLVAAPASFIFGSVPLPLLITACGMGLAVGVLSALPIAGARLIVFVLYMMVAGLFESAQMLAPAVTWFPGQPALIIFASVFAGNYVVTTGIKRYLASRHASPGLRSVLEAIMHDEDSSSFPSIRRRHLPPPRTRIGTGV